MWDTYQTVVETEGSGKRLHSKLDYDMISSLFHGNNNNVLKVIEIRLCGHVIINL